MGGRSILALPLLVARVRRADDAHDALAPDDLAVAADFLYGGEYFHVVQGRGTMDEGRGSIIAMFTPSRIRSPCPGSLFVKCSVVRLGCLGRPAARSSLAPHPYFARNVILARDKSYGVNSTVTLSPGRILM